VNGGERMTTTHPETKWDAAIRLKLLRFVEAESPTKLFNALFNIRPKLPAPYSSFGVSALRTAYHRARDWLPQQYRQQIAIVESRGGRSFGRERARDLVDSVIVATGDHRLARLNEVFDYMERRVRWDGNYAKDIRWLEHERDKMAKDDLYWPELKPLQRDILAEKVFLEIELKGPQSRQQLMQTFGKTASAMASVGVRMRKRGEIVNIRRDGKVLWALASTHAAYVGAANAILAELAEGNKTDAEIAKRTGIKRGTIKSARGILVKQGKVVPSEGNTYALPGRGLPRISTSDAVEAALTKNDDMDTNAIARNIGRKKWAVQRALRRLIEKKKVIPTSRSTYALAGAKPAYISTRDSVIALLSKKGEMRFGAIVKSLGRSPSAVIKALSGLLEEGVIKKVGLGVYRKSHGVETRN
jgi:predicted transcriptional regulator